MSGLISGILVGVLVGYVTHILIHRHTEKSERKLDRFQKLYSPFAKLRWKEMHSAVHFSDLDECLQK
jgi:hypothetical protein